jgi:hypothetical protein
MIGIHKPKFSANSRLLAVGVLSKYILATKLTDVLRLGGGAIVSIKAAGQFNKFDDDDIEFKKVSTISFIGTHGNK